MTRDDGGDCYDWSFLAIAHLQSDHKSEARKVVDRATAWMEENERKSEKGKLPGARFRSFRAKSAGPRGRAKGDEGTPTKHWNRAKALKSVSLHQPKCYARVFRLSPDPARRVDRRFPASLAWKLRRSAERAVCEQMRLEVIRR